MGDEQGEIDATKRGRAHWGTAVVAATASRHTRCGATEGIPGQTVRPHRHRPCRQPVTSWPVPLSLEPPQSGIAPSLRGSVAPWCSYRPRAAPVFPMRAMICRAAKILRCGLTVAEGAVRGFVSFEPSAESRLPECFCFTSPTSPGAPPSSLRLTVPRMTISPYRSSSLPRWSSQPLVSSRSFSRSMSRILSLIWASP